MLNCQTINKQTKNNKRKQKKFLEEKKKCQVESVVWHHLWIEYPNAMNKLFSVQLRCVVNHHHHHLIWTICVLQVDITKKILKKHKSFGKSLSLALSYRFRSWNRVFEPINRSIPIKMSLLFSWCHNHFLCQNYYFGTHGRYRWICSNPSPKSHQNDIISIRNIPHTNNTNNKNARHLTSNRSKAFLFFCKCHTQTTMRIHWPHLTCLWNFRLIVFTFMLIDQLLFCCQSSACFFVLVCFFIAFYWKIKLCFHLSSRNGFKRVERWNQWTFVSQKRSRRRKKLITILCNSHTRSAWNVRKKKRRTRVRVGIVTHVFFAVLDEWITSKSIVLRCRHSYENRTSHNKHTHEKKEELMKQITKTTTPTWACALIQVKWLNYDSFAVPFESTSISKGKLQSIKIKMT